MRARLRIASASSPLIGVLGPAVDLAQKVRQETLEADAVAFEEGAIVQVLAHQGVRESQHHRHICVGSKRQPRRVQEVRGVVAKRTEVDELDALVARAAQPVARRVRRHAAGVDLGVLERDAAEHHHQLAVLGDGRPVGRPGQDLAQGADDVRQDHLGRGVAVGVDRAGVAARHVEEAMDLAMGVVKAPRARPAVGAGIDRLRPVLAPHPRDLTRDQVEGLVPVERHEGLGAAAGAVAAVPPFEPAGPDHGLRDAQRAVDGVGNRLADR